MMTFDFWSADRFGKFMYFSGGYAWTVTLPCPSMPV